MGGPPTSNLAHTHECTNEGDVDHKWVVGGKLSPRSHLQVELKGLKLRASWIPFEVVAHFQNSSNHTNCKALLLFEEVDCDVKHSH